MSKTICSDLHNAFQHRDAISSATWQHNRITAILAILDGKIDKKEITKTFSRTAKFKTVGIGMPRRALDLHCHRDKLKPTP
jgi:hypothetical protein